MSFRTAVGVVVAAAAAAAASGRSGSWFGSTEAPTLLIFALPAGGR